jgi:putative spermidine/putrescine transport system permease protein
MAGLGPASWLLRAYALGFFAFLLLPLAVVVLVSFASDPYITFPPSGVSLRWFRAVFDEPSFVLGITNSVKLALAATAVSILLAVPAALALVRYRFPGRDALESWLLSPLSLPLIVLGVALLFFLGRLGLGLSAFGLLAAHVVITVPYVLRTVTAVYRSADRTIEEAARVLGASPWQTFRRITLPVIRPGLAAGAIFSFLISFDNLPVSIFLTGPQTTTLPVSIFSYLIYHFDPSIAAISTMEIAAVVVALLAIERLYGLRNLTAFSQ